MNNRKNASPADDIWIGSGAFYLRSIMDECNGFLIRRLQVRVLSQILWQRGRVGRLRLPAKELNGLSVPVVRIHPLSLKGRSVMVLQTPKGCDRIPKESRRAAGFDPARMSSILFALICRMSGW